MWTTSHFQYNITVRISLHETHNNQIKKLTSIVSSALNFL